MDRTDSHAPTAAPHAAQQPHGGLVEWHSVSVLRYADGVTRASYNHLDMNQRKLVTEALPEPTAPTPGWPWHLLALLAAAEELEARHTDDHSL